MDKFLSESFDAAVNHDDAALDAALDSFIIKKAKAIVREEIASPIKLKGDDVLVNGKQVGSIKYDMDRDEKFTYTPTTGDKMNFENLKELYAHLAKIHKLSEEVDEDKKQWDIFLRGKKIKTVTSDPDCTAAEMKKDLIDNEDCDPAIVVKPHTIKRGKDMKEEKAPLYGLYTCKKDAPKCFIQFTGTRAECEQEWKDTKDDWKGHTHKIVKTTDDTPIMNEEVETYEKRIQAMGNKLKISPLKAYVNPDKDFAGQDADGDTDGDRDAAAADEKRQEPLKELIKKVKERYQDK